MLVFLQLLFAAYKEINNPDENAKILIIITIITIEGIGKSFGKFEIIRKFVKSYNVFIYEYIILYLDFIILS